MFYRLIRDWHLYLGLFVSPFILLFAVSVFFLNHAKVDTSRWDVVDPPRAVPLPEGIETAQGPAAVALARLVMGDVGIDGEIGFVRVIRSTRHVVFPVSRPGLEAVVDVDLKAATATVSRRRAGFLESISALHKMPGPHNVAIRGNWVGIRVWRWFADATIWLTCFVSVSGIFLWTALRAERRAGLMLLAAGALSMAGVMYAVLR